MTSHFKFACVSICNVVSLVCYLIAFLLGVEVSKNVEEMDNVTIYTQGLEWEKKMWKDLRFEEIADEPESEPVEEDPFDVFRTNQEIAIVDRKCSDGWEDIGNMWEGTEEGFYKDGELRREEKKNDEIIEPVPGIFQSKMLPGELKDFVLCGKRTEKTFMQAFAVENKCPQGS